MRELTDAEVLAQLTGGEKALFDYYYKEAIPLLRTISQLRIQSEERRKLLVEAENWVTEMAFDLPDLTTKQQRFKDRASEFAARLRKAIEEG